MARSKLARAGTKRATQEQGEPHDKVGHKEAAAIVRMVRQPQELLAHLLCGLQLSSDAVKYPRS
jgi:hypothetical protein